MLQLQKEQTTSSRSECVPLAPSQSYPLGRVTIENTAWTSQSLLPLINWMALEKVPSFVKFKLPMNGRYASILCTTQKKKTKLTVVSIKYIGRKTAQFQRCKM